MIKLRNIEKYFLINKNLYKVINIFIFYNKSYNIIVNLKKLRKSCKYFNLSLNQKII